LRFCIVACTGSDIPSRTARGDPYGFEPIPFASARHDGWTPERQRGFIHVLSRIGIVTFAAKAVGMSRKSAYALLDRAGPDSDFARIWREAKGVGQPNAWFTAVGRAIERAKGGGGFGAAE
jgi:hypothetical protein